MFTYSVTLALFTSALVYANASPEADYAEHTVCDRYPQLRLCALRFDLDQAIQEVAFMIRAVEQQQPQVLVAQPSDDLITGKAKRKSAFVRFGKRAAPSDDSAELFQRPSRKSSFVRFG